MKGGREGVDFRHSRRTDREGREDGGRREEGDVQRRGRVVRRADRLGDEVGRLALDHGEEREPDGRAAVSHSLSMTSPG